MPNLREKYREAMSNPNIKAAAGGCIFFLILVTILIAAYAIIIISTSSGSVPAFVQIDWSAALEEGDLEAYKNLWDKEARVKNKEHYDKAAQLIGKELMIDRKKIKYVQDLQNNNVYYAKDIPVTLIDDGTGLLTYRDLKIEKKGLLRRWKIIDDEVYVLKDFLEEETPLVAEGSDSTDEETFPPSDLIEEETLPPSDLTDEDKFLPSDQVEEDTFPPSDQVEEDTFPPSDLTDEETFPPAAGYQEDRSDVAQAAKEESYSEIVDIADRFDPYQSYTSYSISGNAPLDTKLKISQVIGEWQTAWQKKDVGKYMSKYAEDAVITRVTMRNGKQYPMTLTKDELRRQMERISRRDQTIEVTVSDLQVDGDFVIADVRFRQKYVNTFRNGIPVYSDIGTKTMIFITDSSDGYWKIYEENWRRYVRSRRFPQL